MGLCKAITSKECTCHPSPSLFMTTYNSVIVMTGLVQCIIRQKIVFMYARYKFKCKIYYIVSRTTDIVCILSLDIYPKVRQKHNNNRKISIPAHLLSINLNL